VLSAAQPSCLWKVPEMAALLIESEPRLDTGSKTNVTFWPPAGIGRAMSPDPPRRPKFGLFQLSLVANLYP
jgi:hypothetical protein